MRSRKAWTLVTLAVFLMVLAGCGASKSGGGGGGSAGPAGSSAPAPKPAAPPFYQGKTVTILVPYSPGGSTDVLARLLAPNLAKSLPGHPQVMVENKPGGDGAIAFNHTFKVAKPDGLTLVISSSGIPQRWLQRDQGHDYDLTKLPIIGAFTDTNVYYISKKAADRLGIKAAKDLLAVKTPISMGQIDREGVLNVIQELIKQDIKIPFKTVAGYKGFGEVLLAVLGGEVDGGAIAYSGYASQVRPHEQDGKVIPLFQGGIFDPSGKMVRDPRLPDVPTYAELYAMAGMKTEGPVWQGLVTAMQLYGIGWAFYLPPGTPADRVTELSAAFKVATESADFKKEARTKMGSEAQAIDAAQSAALLQTFTATPATVITTWRQAVK